MTAYQMTLAIIVRVFNIVILLGMAKILVS